MEAQFLVLTSITNPVAQLMQFPTASQFRQLGGHLTEATHVLVGAYTTTNKVKRSVLHWD